MVSPDKIKSLTAKIATVMFTPVFLTLYLSICENIIRDRKKAIEKQNFDITKNKIINTFQQF